MASNNNNKKAKPRAPKDGANPKKFKKKTSILVTDKVEYVDYKDVNLLTRFVSDRSKIRNRRVTGSPDVASLLPEVSIWAPSGHVHRAAAAPKHHR